MVLSRMPNDCVVTALANYTGFTYDEVFGVLDAVRRDDEGHGQGYYKDTWLFALRCLRNRWPKRTLLLNDGLLRFQHILGGDGHLVVIRKDGTVIDGTMAKSDKYSLTQYQRVYPYLVIDEVWQ